MPLPTLPTTKEIRDRIIVDIESKLNQTTPLLFKALNRVLAGAIALVFTILYKFGQYAVKQIFTVTQDADSLQLKGDQYDIPRNQATNAILAVDMTGSVDGTTIPVGTRYRSNSNGLIYTTNTSVTITGGIADTEITCITAGDSGNLIATDELTILSPIQGVDNIILVSGIALEAVDQEDIELYRGRIQDREKRPPQGGSKVDYIYWAQEVEGVVDAFAYGKRDVPTIPAGYIVVYPILEAPDRIPDSVKLTEIHDYIQDPTRAPLQVPVINVLAMIEREFKIDVANLNPDTPEIRQKFVTDVEAFLLTRTPQQFIDEENLRNVVSRSYIESIGIQSGAQSLTVTLLLDGVTPTENYTLSYNELSISSGVTFV